VKVSWIVSGKEQKASPEDSMAILLRQKLAKAEATNERYIPCCTTYSDDDVLYNVFLPYLLCFVVYHQLAYQEGLAATSLQLLCVE